MATLFFNKIINGLKKNKDARFLLYWTSSLIIIGFLAVASCSAMVSINSPFDCISKHIMNICLGFFLFLIASFFDYTKYRKVSFFLFILTTVLLLSTVFFREINGAHRWINLGFFNFQPSEMAKLVMIILMSDFITRHKHHINTWNANVFPCIYLGVFGFIIFIMQSDLGTAFLLFAIWSSLLIVAKIDVKRMFLIALACILALAVAIAIKPYRRKRVLTFVKPVIQYVMKDKNAEIETPQSKAEKIKNSDSYNSDIAFAAFGSGGLTGKGAGKSDTKLRYLPEKHTDYIFPIIGEEHGLIGTLVTVFLFIMFTKTALNINSKCKDEFGKYLSLGIILTITGQAIINMGMTTGLLPSKGIPLPFISYGGSAMLINCYMVGILVNIARSNSRLL